MARAELDVVGRELGWEGDALAVVEVEGKGPGNALLCEVEAEHARELFAAFGERGRPAEAVALAAVQEVREYLALDVPVGPHLADQLLLLCALAGGGRFRTGALTGHTRTQVEVIERFLPLSVARRDLGAGVFELEVLPRD